MGIGEDGMKPWEETWTSDGESIRRVGDGHFRLDAVGVGAESEARAKLAAAAPEMARLLLELEAVSDYYESKCPVCGAVADIHHADARGRVWRVEHEPSCRWVAVLRKAGVLE